MHNVLTLLLSFSMLQIGTLAGPSDDIKPDNFDNRRFEEVLLIKMNMYRQEKGLDTLIHSPRLVNVSKDHIAFLRDKKTISHHQPTIGKRNVNERFNHYIKAESYTIGENIAKIFVLTSSKNYLRNGKQEISVVRTYDEAAESMLNAWIQSEYHNKNILKAVFDETSISSYYHPTEKTLTAVQVFAHVRE